MATEFRLMLNTCPSLEVAQELASALVERKLAACVNIVPGLVSVYQWQGKIEKDTEVLLVIKTRDTCYAAVEALIQELHPYELPEVVSVTIEKGLPQYLSWIDENVEAR